MIDITSANEKITHQAAKIRELERLVRRAKNAIDHARQWRKNVDIDYKDEGIYRLVSDEIKQYLGE